MEIGQCVVAYSVFFKRTPFTVYGNYRNRYSKEFDGLLVVTVFDIRKWWFSAL